MTKFESEMWYLFCGVQGGMLLCFWFYPDIEFFWTVWPVVMSALMAWAFVRREKDGKDG